MRRAFVFAASACIVACEAETLLLLEPAPVEDANVAPDAIAVERDAGVGFADASLPDAIADVDADAPDTGPVEPLDPETIVELASGGHHSCVRRASGHVACWGSSATGELEGGEAMEGALALAMGGYPSVALPSGHTCSLRGDGQAWCWGQNYNGQLGREVGRSGHYPAGPMPVPDVIAIGAGSFHTCVIDRSRALFCAGLNNTSQLARAADEVDHPVPLRIEGVEGAAKVVMGGWHMCAMSIDGSVRCWGDDLRGKLGGGSGPPQQTVPQRVLHLEDAIDLASQQEHTCAVRRTGNVVCWGENLFGQLGYGQRDDWGEGVPQTVLGIEDATRVAVGQKHSCALRANGEVWCWGHNEDGQLGNDGVEMWSFTPVRVVGIENAIALASGQKHACALIEGTPRTVMCWGRDRNDELGDGMRQNTAIAVRATAADR